MKGKYFFRTNKLISNISSNDFEYSDKLFYLGYLLVLFFLYIKGPSLIYEQVGTVNGVSLFVRLLQVIIFGGAFWRFAKILKENRIFIFFSYVSIYATEFITFFAIRIFITFLTILIFVKMKVTTEVSYENSHYPPVFYVN